MRAVMATTAELILHTLSFLAIVGLVPLGLDLRLGLAMLHTVAMLMASRKWPRTTQRYLWMSTAVLVSTYVGLMCVIGPAQMLARTFALAGLARDPGQPLAQVAIITKNSIRDTTWASPVRR